jgi:hypothetical protein
MHCLRAGTLVISALIASGCTTTLDSVVDRWVGEEDRVFARQFLSLMSAGDVDSAYQLLDPEGQTNDARIALQEVSSFLEGATFDSLSIVSVEVVHSSEGRALGIGIEASTERGWIHAILWTRTGESGPRATGIWVRPIEDSLFRLNAFTLSHRSPVHYVWLILMAASFAFCLISVVRLATARGLPRHWLWAILAIVAAPQLTLDWTTGAVTFHPLSLVLLGVSAWKAGPAGPWALTLGVPIGAALAFGRHLRWRRTHHELGADSAPARAA